MLKNLRISRLIAIVGISGVCAVSLVPMPARAEKEGPSADATKHHDKAKELIRVTIRVLEARVGELERTASFDTREAKELEAHAALRDRTADQMAARAKEYRELIAKLPPGDPIRAELETIASALESGATHDHEFATQRRAAAKILADQAKQATEFIRLDKLSIEHYKTLL